MRKATHKQVALALIAMLMSSAFLEVSTSEIVVD